MMIGKEEEEKQGKQIIRKRQDPRGQDRQRETIPAGGKDKSIITNKDRNKKRKKNNNYKKITL